MTQGTQTRALKQPRGVRWRFKREGTYVYLWLIHRDSISKRPETIIKSGLVMWGSA